MASADDPTEDPNPGEATPSDAERASQEALLRTEGLTRRFGELVAVDDVSLAVERGEFRSVIGPNGAGKTTLFNCITGALAPSEGTIRFDGRDVTAMAPYERVRAGIGRSFQITTVFAGLTVRENVRLAVQSASETDLGLYERFLRPTTAFDDVQARVDEITAQVGLSGRGDERAGALAYGDRRRLEIALVLGTDPEVVLLDEPTAGMSTDETRETMGLIREVLADRTLLLIEHDIDLVMSVSDTITVLYRGQELTTGTPEAVAGNDRVQEAYLGGVEL